MTTIDSGSSLDQEIGHGCPVAPFKGVHMLDTNRRVLVLVVGPFQGTAEDSIFEGLTKVVPKH